MSKTVPSSCSSAPKLSSPSKKASPKSIRPAGIGCKRKRTCHADPASAVRATSPTSWGFSPVRSMKRDGRLSSPSSSKSPTRRGPKEWRRSVAPPASTSRCPSVAARKANSWGPGPEGDSERQVPKRASAMAASGPVKLGLHVDEGADVLDTGVSRSRTIGSHCVVSPTICRSSATSVPRGSAFDLRTAKRIAVLPSLPSKSTSLLRRSFAHTFFDKS
mmetsp:Transcript_45511/g.132489  ORF Transcript_45511/g.132489 Transcript_45511/m.132489 type:complete len:218 (-) Transcript_45511:139-792(-)